MSAPFSVESAGLGAENSSTNWCMKVRRSVRSRNYSVTVTPRKQRVAVAMAVEERAKISGMLIVKPPLHVR